MQSNNFIIKNINNVNIIINNEKIISNIDHMDK